MGPYIKHVNRLIEGRFMLQELLDRRYNMAPQVGQVAVVHAEAHPHLPQTSQPAKMPEQASHLFRG